MDSMQRVLSYFREICSIPRRSGDESNVAQYLIETGKRLGLEVDQDAAETWFSAKRFPKQRRLQFSRLIWIW